MTPLRLLALAAAGLLALPIRGGHASDSEAADPVVRRKPLISTALAAAGYNKRHHVLEIEFCNGAIYRYLEVPPSTYRKLLAANSKTRYYDSEIKGRYRSVRLHSAQSRMVRFNDKPPGQRTAPRLETASE
jgi:KTSC domain